VFIRAGRPKVPVVYNPDQRFEIGKAVEIVQGSDLTFAVNGLLVAAVSLIVDSGEAEAIALAQERGWRIILDDQRARSVAARPGASCDWHHRRPAASQAGRSHRFTPPPLG